MSRLKNMKEIIELIKDENYGWGFYGVRAFYKLKKLGVIRPSFQSSKIVVLYDWDLVKRSISNYRNGGEIYTEDEYFNKPNEEVNEEVNNEPTKEES